MDDGEDSKWREFAEETRWPGLIWVTLRWLEGCFFNVTEMPGDACSPLAVLFCLCAPLPTQISDPRRRAAAMLNKASVLVGGSMRLRARARNFALPMEKAVTVMPVDIPAPGATGALKFGWRPAVEGDPSLHNVLAMLGVSLLRDSGLPEQRIDGIPSAVEVMAEAMTLLKPGGESAADPESIERAARRGAESWPHRNLLPRTRELLLEFRREPGGELGIFVDEARLNQWLERVGTDDIAA
jgi:hypothetical protein